MEISTRDTYDHVLLYHWTSGGELIKSGETSCKIRDHCGAQLNIEGQEMIVSSMRRE